MQRATFVKAEKAACVACMTGLMLMVSWTAAFPCGLKSLPK